jgi:hypothetical protein
VKRRAVTVMGALLILAHPLECVILRTVHYKPVIQTSSKMSNFLEKGT